MFLEVIFESEPATSAIGQTARDALELVRNPEVKVYLSFLTAFAKTFWDPAYNWIRRKDAISKLDGHSCHEVLLQVFTMSELLNRLQTS